MPLRPQMRSAALRWWRWRHEGHCLPLLGLLSRCPAAALTGRTAHHLPPARQRPVHRALTSALRPLCRPLCSPHRLSTTTWEPMPHTAHHTHSRGLLAVLLYQQLPAWWAARQQRKAAKAAAAAAKAAAVDAEMAAYWAQCKAEQAAAYQQWVKREQQREQLKTAVRRQRVKRGLP